MLNNDSNFKTLDTPFHEQEERVEALRKSEEMLAESQRLAKIGSFELDVETRLLTWSEQQYRNFGFEPGSSMARERAIERIDPRDFAQHEETVWRSIAQGERFEMHYRVIHPDGQVRHLHTIGRPVVDAAGRVIKVVGTSQDVTERHLLEEQLRAQYEQLKALDALRGNFFDSVTHELRTPLTTVLGYTEILHDGVGGPLNPRQYEFIRRIRRGALRLEHLVNDLLDFARIEASSFTLRMAPAELGERLCEALASLQIQAEEKQLTLDAHLPDGPIELVMDAQRIGQVLTNYLVNAIKFAPPGSRIRASVRRRGETVRCEIEDEGPGIAPADLPRLFQRFSQLEAGRRTGKGAGLGLAISKSLVEAHGGRVGVESAPGLGSTFWFELPTLPHTETGTQDSVEHGYIVKKK